MGSSWLRNLDDLTYEYAYDHLMRVVSVNCKPNRLCWPSPQPPDWLRLWMEYNDSEAIPFSEPMEGEDDE